MSTQDVNETNILSAIVDLFDQTVETTREQILDAALNLSSTREEVAFFLVEAFAELLRHEMESAENADATTAFVRAKRLLNEKWNVDPDFKSATLVAIKRRLIETEYAYAKIPVDPLDLGVRFPEEKEFLKALTNQSVGTSKLDARLQSNYYAIAIATPARQEKEKLEFKDEFVVGKHIATGGQKDAYEITRQGTDQRLVLKELRTDQNRPEEREALRREANFQATLSHPGVPLVVSFDDSKQTAESPKLVEQFVPAGNWKSAIDRLSLDENLNVLLQVAKILSFAHREKGIAHLDVKPENVMLGNYGEIFLVDWGMAQELKPGEKAQRLGTPAYFAPEVVNKEPISAAVDVFALGGALYRILVGFAPYERAQSLLDAMRRAKRCDFPPIPESAPHDLRALAEKALARNPNNRFADAGEFADALERVRRRAPILARRENAENSLEELKHTFEQIDGDRQASAKQKRKRRARLADALVGNVNEFALARRAFIDLAKKEEERDDDNEQPDDKRPNDDARRAENALLRADFARAEIDARKYQLKQSLALGDFSQASALVDALRDLQTQEFALAAPDAETLFSEEYRSQSQNAVEEFDRAAQRGLAERRRAAALKAVSAALLVAVAVMLAWNLKTANEKNEAQKKAAQEQAAKIFNVHDFAAKQAIRDRVPQQAIVEYFQAAQEISDAPETKDVARHARALMETTAQTSLLLQRESAFASNIKQTSFSRNGDAFAILDNLGNLIAWNADDLTSFAWKRVDNPDNLHLRPNPLYKSRDAATPKEAAPFLTVNSRGAVRLFGDKTNSYELLLNVFRDEPDDLEVSCRPAVSQTDASAPRLFVATSRGDVMTINLATKKKDKESPIEKKVKLFDEGIARVEAENDRIVARSKSGAIKTCKLNGDDARELTLDATQQEREDLFNFSLSRDGAKLALSFQSGDACVLDVATDKRLVSFPTSKKTQFKDNFIQNFFWMNAEDELLSLGANNELCVWKIDGAGQATVLRALDVEQRGGANGWGAYAYSPSSKKLATFGNDFTLRISDVHSGKVVAQSTGIVAQKMNGFTVADVAYNPASDRFIVASFGPHGLLSFDGKTLAPKTEFETFWDVNAPVVATYLAVHPKKDEFAVAFDDGALAVYSGDKPEPRKKLDGAFKDAVPIAKGSALCNLPIVAASGDDGKIAGSTLKGNEIILWDWELKELKRIESKLDARNRIALTFIDDDTLLETISPLVLRFWNLKTEEIEREIRVDEKSQDGDNNVLNSILNAKFFSAPPALSNDRKKLALGFSNGEFLALDLESFKEISRANLPNLRNRLKIGVDDFRSANYGDEPDVFQQQSVTGLDWSNDDRMLVVGSSDAVSSVVMLEQENKLRFFCSFVSGVAPNETSTLNQFRYNPFFTRDKTLIGVTTDGVLRAWDFEPNDEDGFDVASLSGADAVATSRDGRSRLCLRREGLRPGLCSFVDEQERWFVPDVKEFRLWQAPDGKERCLTLDKDGKLLALDIETGSATSTPRDLAQGFPKNGFRDLATSPDGKALAGVAADSKNVFVFDHNDATPKWTPILDADVEADVYQIDFSVDSAILGVATQFGEFSEIRLWDAQRKFFLASEGGDSLKASQNVALNATCGKLRFIDERFAVYTGLGNDVSIFDVKKRALHQRLEAPIVSALARKLYTITGVASLNQGIGRDKATTFVIGGPDGILRFYQFSPERELFDNVWNISWLQFDRIVKSKLSPRFDDSQDDADDTQIDENLTNDASDNDLDLSKFGVDLEDIDDTQNDADDIGFDENLPNDASDNDFDLSKFDVDLDDIDVLPYQFRDVNDLYVSSDGKTLYVSTLDGVRAYDLEKIWKKIETVGQNWDAESVEHATGLRTTPTGSLETTLRNRLQRVEE